LMAFIMIQAGGIRKYGLKHHLQNIIPYNVPRNLDRSLR
jgi:hypothetical protein